MIRKPLQHIHLHLIAEARNQAKAGNGIAVALLMVIATRDDYPGSLG